MFIILIVHCSPTKRQSQSTIIVDLWCLRCLHSNLDIKASVVQVALEIKVLYAVTYPTSMTIAVYICSVVNRSVLTLQILLTDAFISLTHIERYFLL